MHAVKPIRVHIVEAAESIPPVKAAEAMDDEAATAEVDATKSVEPTKVEATEMASSEVTTTEVATTKVTTAEPAGIRDLGQHDHSRNKRCGDEREELATHDTLLLDDDLLVATEVPGKWRSCGFFSRIYRSRFIAVPTRTASAARWCRR